MSELAALVNEALKAEVEARRIVEDARRRADEILKEAKLEARRIVEDARRRSEIEEHYRRTLESAMQEVEELSARVEELRRLIRSLKERRAELVEQLAMFITDYVLGGEGELAPS
ncbi:MAG: hypothetical protein DRJ43_00315 [Thermoprotei archaeon]|nr:MAG: hypothetical protein DRJ43_00315 [Thermoprotei archaeon]